jgi:carnosine N-methyltransferase
LINSAVGYDTKIQRTRQLIWQNDKVAQAIVDCGLEFYEIGFAELISYVREAEAAGTSVDRVSVAQTLKHFVRDWAVDGEHERSPMFPQILETLDKLFPRPGRDKIRVLVPGSGLNRLAHDIAGLGGKHSTLSSRPYSNSLPSADFEVTANEWSSYMNIAYRYVTSLRQPNSTVIHPFLDWWSHQPTTSELHRRVTFPDIPVDASAALLVEGDFTTAFKGRDDTGHYDAVVTFFFIDTARSLLSYLETIHRLLKPGENATYPFRWANFSTKLTN